jgi:hypothetical protein
MAVIGVVGGTAKTDDGHLAIADSEDGRW